MSVQNPKPKIQKPADAPSRYAVAGVLLSLAVMIAFTLIGPKHFPETPFRPELILDKPVPDFRLNLLSDVGKKGERIGPLTFQGKKTVVLYFLSGQCGMCRMTNPRVIRWIQSDAGRDVALLGVRCNALDTPAEMQKWAETKRLPFPILNDERGMTSAYFQVAHTPTFAIIDRRGILRYLGAFDDNLEEAEVKRRFAPDALAALAAGQPVAVKSHVALGCAITSLKDSVH